MKKILLILLGIVAFLNVTAKDKWNIEASIGTHSNRVFFQNKYIGGHYFEIPNYYTLGVNYLMLNQRLHLGIKTLGGFEKGKATILNMPNDSIKSYTYQLQAYGLMANVNYDWIKNNHWSFNSGFAIGALHKVLDTSLSTKNKKSYHFIYQLDALKVRYGGDFGVFAKIGWGIEGVLGIGVNYRI